MRGLTVGLDVEDARGIHSAVGPLGEDALVDLVVLQMSRIALRKRSRVSQRQSSFTGARQQKKRCDSRGRVQGQGPPPGPQIFFYKFVRHVSIFKVLPLPPMACVRHHPSTSK